MKSDSTGVGIGNVKMRVNPFDDIAAGEVVRVKERSVATEVAAVTSSVAHS